MKQSTIEQLGDWYLKLNNIFESAAFEKIVQQISFEYQNSQCFPAPENIFKAFEKCQYKDLRVCWIGIDPYPGVFKYNNREMSYATGLSFSNPIEAKNVAPSLANIRHAAIESGYFFFDQTLENWAEKGCLMLNTALTIKRGSTGSHSQIWKPFTEELLEFLGKENGLIFILLGKDAQYYKKFIDESVCYIVEAEHPQAANYQGRQWIYNDLFNKVNKILEGLYGKEARVVW